MGIAGTKQGICSHSREGEVVDRDSGVKVEPHNKLGVNCFIEKARAQMLPIYSEENLFPVLYFDVSSFCQGVCVYINIHPAFNVFPIVG